MDTTASERPFDPTPPPTAAGESTAEKVKAKASEVAHEAADRAREVAADAPEKIKAELLDQWERVRANAPEFLYPSVAEAALANAQRTEANLAYYGENPSMIDRRLTELEDEWDARRVLQVVTSSLTLAGFWLSLTKSRVFTLLPLALAAGTLHHGLTNASPAEDLARRLGFRTRDEIEHERRALLQLQSEQTTTRLTDPQMG
jgi:hypothetical protein